jgi:hypothetical protein
MAARSGLQQNRCIGRTNQRQAAHPFMRGDISMSMKKVVVSALTLALLCGGAALAKTPAPTAKPAAKSAPTKKVTTPEGVLEKLEGSAVTIKQSGKSMRYTLAKNVNYLPNRSAMKPGERVKLMMNGQKQVAIISKA